MRLPVLFASLAIALSGCALSVPNSVEVDGSGLSTGTETRTATCGTFAQLDRYLAGGGGGVDITVKDARGNVVFHDPSIVTGEINDQQNLTGAAGTWTLVVDPNGFSGQFKVTLDCP